MKTILTLVLSALLTSVNIANAAGFDCAKASTTIEKMICSNDVLNKLDDKNSQLFSQYKAQSIEVGLTIQDQRDWLKHTRNTCLDTICLEDVYQKRNTYLSSRIEAHQMAQLGGNTESSPTQSNHIASESHETIPPVQSAVGDNTSSSGDLLVAEPTQQAAAANEQSKQQTPVTSNVLPVPDTHKDNLTLETTKLTRFTAQHAKAISGLIVFLVLMSGLLFPVLMRRVF